MKTDRLIDDASLPLVRTALARVFLPPKPPVTPEDADQMVAARDRLHEREVMWGAAFCAGWSLIAVACFLPWGGSHGWWMAPRLLLCLAAWLPVWLLVLQLLVVVPGALCALLVERRILIAAEARLLMDSVVLLALSVAACVLVASSCLACQIVGDIWLFVLLLEGMLRVVLLVSKLLK
ncbi:MAG: hypothetical protein K1X78_02815 [Verrucomicrobiaceae bacterium]|nr:hypothetical protein [Verrucomicrobiaceae bacterium]